MARNRIIFLAQRPIRNLSLAIALTALVLFSTNANAEDCELTIHQHSASSQNARFEIVQSALAAKYTFKIDKFSGRIWQLIKTKDDNTAWEEMLVVGATKNQNANHPKFQLFTSGLAARHTFLIDTDTGKTWIVVTAAYKRKEGGGDQSLVWQPFSE